MLNKGQSIVEYVLLVGIATMGLMFMGTDFKRGIQSVFKVTVDQLGSQSKSDQDFTLQSTGTLVNSFTQANQELRKTTYALGNNATRVVTNDWQAVSTNATTNMSYTAELPDNSDL